MTTSEAELQQLLNDAYRLDRGPARWAALDAVFRHADAADNLAFGYRARLGALSDLHHNGEYARALMAFSWCLATFDHHPEVTHPPDTRTLLLGYKWIIWELTKFSAVPLDRGLAVMEDMQRRYQSGGHSLHAVYQHRGLFAHHLGDLAGAGHWYGEMLTARRDSLSDCAACVPSGHAAYLAAAGRYAEAVEVGSPYTTGGCTEQPHWMLSELLVPYLRTGRSAEAVAAHKRSYARIRDSRHHLELIGLNVEFCGLTGNEGYALSIVERHLPWLDRPSSPYAAMEFASATALVLRRLAEAGQARSPVRRRSDDGTRRWDSSVAETLVEMTGLARSLAAAFDARNGNDYQSRRVEARLAAEPLVAGLPLTVLQGRPIPDHNAKSAIDALVRQVADLAGAGEAAGAARTQLDVAYALRNAAQWADATETAEEARRSLDRAGLTEDALAARYLLVELYQRGHNRVQVHALVDELLAAPPPWPPAVPPAEVLLEQTAQGIDGPRAVDQLTRAAAIHRGHGDVPAEVRCLRKAVQLARDPLPAGSPLVARMDELIAAGEVDAAEVADIEDALCRILAAAGDATAALERAERSAHPLLARRAELLLALGRHAEAEQVGRQAMGLTDDSAWRGRVVVARSLRAQGRDTDAEAFIAEQNLEGFDLDEEY